MQWLRRLEQGRDRGEVKWDQDVFNDIMRDGFDWDADEDCWMPWESCSNKRIDRLFYGANATALIGILPVSLFCSGHTYFVQDMPEVIDREPYVVHATFQFSGKVGKRHRFRYVRACASLDSERVVLRHAIMVGGWIGRAFIIEVDQSQRMTSHTPIVVAVAVTWCMIDKSS